MSQHDYVIANGTGAAVRSDLNNALAAIVTQNSGATAPATTYSYQWWADTTTGLLKLRNAANNAWITLFQLDGEWSTLAVENGSAAAPSIYFKDSGTDTGIYSPGTDQVAISTNGSGRLFVDSSGRVGVGTGSPSELLDVYGTGNTTVRISGSSGGGSDVSQIDFFRIGSNVTSSIKAIRDGGNTSGALTFLTASSGTNSERLRITAAGLVGIGTTSPATALQVVGTGRYTSGTESTQIYHNGTVGYIETVGNSTTAIGFANGGSERARIDSSGRLLIGRTTHDYNESLSIQRSNVTTSPAIANLHNTAATSTSKATNWIIRASSQGTGADSTIVLTDNATHNYWFGGNNGGAYVMANTNGVRLSNGGTSWASDSDERVKDIIEPIQDGLDKVGSLRAVIGKYKTDDEDTRRSFLIAQDVQAVLPEAVFDEQGTLMLAYTDTIPLLVAALKESKERIETLEQRLADAGIA